MAAFHRRLGLVAWSTVAALATTLSSCHTCDLTAWHHGDGECPDTTAKVCEKPTVRALAEDLDSLEKHIERYGSVVIQHPSVWGQARLTKHREEFEKTMVKDLCNFNLTLQGSLSRSDQAYFANSFALGVAASGPQAMTTPTVVTSNSATVSTPISTPTPDPTSPVSLDRNPARLPSAIGFNAISAQGITVEPSIYLNQKARYLNHLHELRRINEGDDTGDSPGYALNLIRVPVSILPGKHTQEGHGAEVTMTIKPYLSEELLPTTFRNLVLNDLLEVVGVPLTQFLNDKDQVEHFKIMEKIYEIEFEKHKNWRRVTNLDYQQLTPESQKYLRDSPMLWQILNEPREEKLDPRKATFAMKRMREVLKNSPFVITSTKLRHARRPFPPSQMLDVFGIDEVDNVVSKAIRHFKRDPANKYYTHYPDVQGYLQEELSGAYRFLAEPMNMPLWSYCSPDLVTAIHTRKVETIKHMRDRFADQVLATTKRDITEDITIAFAWAIIVESALLTDHLKRDMREAAAAKNFTCPDNDAFDYFLPNPSKQARLAFNRYVECRWPIIVFALDPVENQQNIADSFSQRREMQLAMSMAFVSGNISARNMTNYARRLETEMETIALNNTITGFSHGNETFGWRFYPRFQSPEIPGNLTVFFRDMLIGSQNRNIALRQRKLEPGQRECTAIVIMPSFVPYATIETASTWFRLTNPKHKDMGCVDAVKLSGKVKAIENCSPQVIDAHCYRDGELDRLLNRAKQLETRLPLQSAKVQVPYENTLGGFAMFNTGITDLAPELYGWYGAPGIDTNDETTLFLIGNHFSVHQTRVVVGGINVADTELLSRQVMRVTIPRGALTLDRKTGTFPECVLPDSKGNCPCPSKQDPPPKKEPAKKNAQQPVILTSGAGAATEGEIKPAAAADTCKGCKERFVSVHVATPYGVTAHLLIPACNVSPPGTRPKAETMGGGITCPDDKAKKKEDADRAASLKKSADEISEKLFEAAQKTKAAADKEAAERIQKAATDAAARAQQERADFQAAVEKALQRQADEAAKKKGTN